jgi:hypothetical protein
MCGHERSFTKEVFMLDQNNPLLYKFKVRIFFSREEAKLVRKGVEPWEGYLEENFRKGMKTKNGVMATFLGWELLELVGALEMEASVSHDRGYAKALQKILDQKILPVKDRLFGRASEPHR